MYQNIAWNNFEKTGDVESFLEYIQFEKIKNQKKFDVNYDMNSDINIDAKGVVSNEVNKSKGSSDKRNHI